ncbi:MAG TPA: glycosyltransferase family 39 protein [Terriglobia bacterium]|nr:glycosyltransferase family 39 protein [Terriglobia bacterium]
MAYPDSTEIRTATGITRKGRYLYVIVLLFASIIFLGSIISPPSLMDDVDAVQAQIARNMLDSGDWVTARLDGVAYLEKAPLVYWSMATSYMIFGVHDWAARIPIALAAILLCLLTAWFGTWAFGRRAGVYAGLCLATCVGLYLFTRILIPDVILTGAIALALWAFLRALEEDEPHPRLWAFIMAASLGVGLLLKSLIAVVFPCGAALAYLVVTRQLWLRRTWQRLHPWTGMLVILLIAAPWHALATLRNPPYFAFTLHSGRGEYHGFLWFYFINEQLLRFLNMRYPRDYNTVPRLWFWLLNLVWLFPWSVYAPAATRLSYKPTDRGGRARLLALCWAGFILVFFTFSTTQEYYTMPCYPAFALLLGSAMALDAENGWLRYGTKFLAILTGLCAVAAGAILFLVRRVPTPGDISSALTSHPAAYTLALGHLEDLTLRSFAYLRTPLALAALAFLLGAVGAWFLKTRRAYLAIALMMVLFIHAARIARAVFDPYMSSHPLAVALEKAPAGKLIVDDQYYAFSAVFFYTNRRALLLNGRVTNLEYGSNAPGAPDVFIRDTDFKRLWFSHQRYYVVAYESALPRFERLVGIGNLHTVIQSGGQMLLTNEPLNGS